MGSLQDADGHREGARDASFPLLPGRDPRLGRALTLLPARFSAQTLGHCVLTLLTIFMVFPLAASDPLSARSSLSWVVLSSGSAEVTVTSTSPLWALERVMKSATTSEVAVNRPLTERTSRRLMVVCEGDARPRR